MPEPLSIESRFMRAPRHSCRGGPFPKHSTQASSSVSPVLQKRETAAHRDRMVPGAEHPLRPGVPAQAETGKKGVAEV